MLATILCTLLGAVVLLAGIALALWIIWEIGWLAFKLSDVQGHDCFDNSDYFMCGLIVLAVGTFAVFLLATLGHKVGCALLAWLGR